MWTGIIRKGKTTKRNARKEKTENVTIGESPATQEADLTKEEDEISCEISYQLINDASKMLQNAVALSWVNKQNVIAVSMMLDTARKRTKITHTLE